MRSQLTGLEVTTSAPALVDGVDALTSELMRYGQGAARMFDALEHDPDCALANALCGMLHLFTLTKVGQAKAAPFLARARAGAPGAGERERMFVEAVSLWEAGRLHAAIAVHRATLARWPGDLLSLKLCQFHELSIGDITGLLATARAAAANHPDNGFVRGMLAFALGQAGLHREAEQSGRQACAAGPDPWARHAVAHSLAADGRPAEGLAWMHEHAGEWEQCSSFLYTHNWWHAALFHLGLGDREGALACFDARIWGVRKDYCQDQLNAISLLARLDMLGLNVGERWGDIADHVAPFVGDHLSGFLDLHYAYALARADRRRELAELIATLDEWAREPADLADVRLKALMPSAARGVAAHAEGRFGSATMLLKALRPDLVRIGGSDVQRQLFELIYRDSVRRGEGCREPLVAASRP